MVVANGTRLCWSCDGDVDFELSTCPYCGADLEAEHGNAEEEQEFNPPYQLEDVAGKERLTEEEPPYVPEEPTAAAIDDETWEQALTPAEAEACRRENRQSLVNDALPLILLLTGAVFGVFGLVLCLYSGQDKLVLEWETSLWPFFLLPSLAMLYYGWKQLSSDGE